MPIAIAIDGPAASGKGTLARRIAGALGLACLDTGLLYRAVARDVRRRGGNLDDVVDAERAARQLDPGSLDDPGLRDPGVGEAASIVAKFQPVRDALLDFQRQFVAQEPGAVLDGRDIGTVVLPHADVKIFVVADTEVRARRRYLELTQRGEDVTYAHVLEVIRRRDARDREREAAPMRPAGDAVVIDTSTMDADQAFAAAMAIVSARLDKS